MPFNHVLSHGAFPIESQLIFEDENGISPINRLILYKKFNGTIGVYIKASNRAVIERLLGPAAFTSPTEECKIAQVEMNDSSFVGYFINKLVQEEPQFQEHVAMVNKYCKVADTSPYTESTLPDWVQLEKRDPTKDRVYQRTVYYGSNPEASIQSLCFERSANTTSEPLKMYLRIYCKGNKNEHPLMAALGNPKTDNSQMFLSESSPRDKFCVNIRTDQKILISSLLSIISTIQPAFTPCAKKLREDYDLGPVYSDLTNICETYNKELLKTLRTSLADPHVPEVYINKKAESFNSSGCFALFKQPKVYPQYRCPDAFICPITKQPIIQPVSFRGCKSTQCFDKNSIGAYISSGLNPKHPISGEPISHGMMVENEALKHRIDQFYLKQQKRTPRAF